MPETSATTTPRRTRAAAKPAAAKAPVKKTPEPAATDPLKVELEYTGDTARYAKFGLPKELEGTVVGNIYAPHGTAKVLLLIVPTEAPKATE